jgi:hypothetical protein
MAATGSRQEGHDRLLVNFYTRNDYVLSLDAQASVVFDIEVASQDRSEDGPHSLSR